ncbi:MAG: excinuclease ABC subunit UvrA [Verrucomicrobiales bacterium]|nr:excinuclease ABC subunit UvrA [Verrucomicrobiales bacterium]
MSTHDFIRLRGARENNLKGFDLDIPLNRFIVVTGLSGSGKSSLAFDTIYAEGQRRYTETFSPYTRQFLERMNKPKVDAIEGIPPAIALSQVNSVRTSRSTVGSMTEVADHLKLLFPLHAELHSPVSGQRIQPWTAGQVADELLAKHADSQVLITFEVPFPPKTKWPEIVAFLQAQGFIRIYAGGKTLRIDELHSSPFTTHSSIPVVADRLSSSADNKSRLIEAIQSAFQYGKGLIKLILPDHQILSFSNKYLDPADHREYTAPSSSLFSFNNPIGACPLCNGFGRTIDIDYDLALPDRNLSIDDGVVKCFSGETMQNCQKDLLKACRKHKIPTDIPFCQLPKKQQDFVIHGEISEGKNLEESYDDGEWYGVKGFFRWLEMRTYKMNVRILLARYRAYNECSACHGNRFKPETLLWTLNGRNLAQINSTPIRDLEPWFSAIAPKDESANILLHQITSRLRYLNQVGLGYLTLGRASRTLSGGELQRVNLTTCLGTSLTGTLFVLDEPSIGLHPRDTIQLTNVLQSLSLQGNTVMVVEHDGTMIAAADHLIELGPRSGAGGGNLVLNASVDELKMADGRWKMKKTAAAKSAVSRLPSSITLQYLSGERSIPLPEKRRPVTGATQWLEFQGAGKHNLHDLDFRIPLHTFTAITGVSGSGKSTLVNEIIYKHLSLHFNRNVSEAGTLRKLSGAQQLDDVLIIDQSPLTRSARSTPLVYVGAYDQVRELFAMTESAQQLGLNAGAFSFNSGTGRCPRCSGTGYEKIEMQFLSDVFVKCPVCEGRRFQDHVLKAQYRGKSIDDILNMTVSEGIKFFNAETPRTQSTPKAIKSSQQIISALQLLEQVGLGYLTLGQPTNQLSGGEAQRLKLVTELIQTQDTSQKKSPRLRASAVNQKSKLIILDEPTTGLHYEDIRVLLQVLQSLVDRGNTLIVIEHNMEVVKCADHILDLGPEAGDQGGQIIATGTPEDIAANSKSRTAPYLAQALASPGSAPQPTGLSSSTHRVQSQNPPAISSKTISIRGAKHHNLKNIDLDIPRNKMVVLTGLSGSGKSSLAFDLLFSEGQRRYLDCLNSYARQFIEQLEKPRVDSITGIPPAVAIEQRTTRGGGKSTVATVTELYHFMRLLYAKLGVQHDPANGEPCIQQTPREIVAQIRRELGKGEARLLAPLVRGRKGIYTELASWAQRKGYPELRVNGKFTTPDKFKALDRYREHNIDLVLGTINAKTPNLEILINQAIEYGHGTIMVDGRLKMDDVKNPPKAHKSKIGHLPSAISHTYSTQLYSPKTGKSFEPLDPRLFSYNSPHGWCPKCQGYGTVADIKTDDRLSELEQEQQQELIREYLDSDEIKACPECHGSRLNETARAVHFAGKPITELNAMNVQDFLRFFGRLKFKGREAAIIRDIKPEIEQRLKFLNHVGLDYLNLDRAAPTLSGGESQRIRLAAQLGSNLQGVLYVLDEPTIGLHPRDNDELIKTLRELQERGNSLVIVEHDEDTMRQADHIIDLGPGAGVNGGHIIAQGTWQQLTKNKQSLTGRLLGTPLKHPLKGSRRKIDKTTEWLAIDGARANNLKNLKVELPLGKFIGISGVSGSGKSTLMHQVIIPAVTEALTTKKNLRVLRASAVNSNKWDTIDGLHNITKLIEVDQSPIGKTSRSTVCTYIGLMDHLRKLMAQVPLAKTRGFSASHFSYNAGAGRCPACMGQGMLKIEMNFLPATYVPCDKCGGKRWTEPVLEVTYRDKNIYDILALSIDEAVEFFDGQPNIQVPLRLLQETGLGYLTLGQTSPTLSGGEAQRIKLVTELAGIRLQEQRHRLSTRAALTGKTLYLLEEPTVGLHLADVQKLLEVIHKLVDSGNTVAVIEHHLDLLAECDYLLDLGPESAADGGRIIASGTPEQVANSKKSHTGKYLRKVL